jgi:inner membrane protein
MDSLTQIVLGAAVAEASLGKKIGNRAMVWGAIGGTLPDMDVLANFFMTPIDALAFHRGPTHSALYLIITSFILGWLVHTMYSKPYHKWFGVVGWSILVLGCFFSFLLMGSFTIQKAFWAIFLLLLSGYLLYKRYSRKSYDRPEVNLKEWIWMFVLVLVTHPILDCFTTYGTQILLPFSPQRVAFNNIAVADPLFTIPFLLCLIIVMYYKRLDPQRSVWNRRGLIISCLYMALTIFNKTRINTIFENSLNQNNVSYNRYMTTPTILNNVLWSGIAETDSAYYYGMYSFFDNEKSFQLNKLLKTEANLLAQTDTDATLKTMKWFSDGYFLIERKSPDSLVYYDLRFGTFKMNAEEESQFVFKFNIAQSPSNAFVLVDQGARPRDANFKEAFAALWDRMMGRTK